MSSSERLGRISQGKFEILGKGAVGGMGEVYAVRHRLLGELRAVKIMRAASASDPQLQERFLQEARTAARLRHPNLVQLYDLAFHNDGSTYMVLEWIEGLDLAKLLNEYGPPPLGAALDLARQALDALGYLHGEGIVHRDISADNLMVSEQAGGGLELKVIDLGIAKSIKHDSGLTRKGLFVGKLHYSAPETLDTKQRRTAPDPRSDLYSFGVVLYEMLTGESPFDGSSESELLAGHLLRKPRPFSESDPDGRVPPELQAIVLKALEKAPDERFQTAAEMAEALAGVEVTFGRSERSGDLRRTITAASSRPLEDATTLAVRQSELDRAFRQGSGSEDRAAAPTRPAGAPDPIGSRVSAEKEIWFDDLRRSYVRRQESSRRSSLVQLLQDHPRPVLGVVAVLVVLVVGYASFLRGGQAPAEPPPAVEGPAPNRPAALTEAPAADVDEVPPEAVPEEGASVPGSQAPPETSSRTAGLRAVALISDDASVATSVARRLEGSFELFVHDDLAEAKATAVRGGPKTAIRLTTTTRSSSVEAYETQIPACEAVVSGQVLSLPGGRALVARSFESSAPRCGEAVALAAASLADELDTVLPALVGRS